MSKRKVLMTGAAGRIGSFLTGHLADQYDFTLTDVRAPQDTHGFPFTEANLTDIEVMRQIAQGVDTVLHLAASVSPRTPWEDLLPNNIIGTYNVFQAAHEAQCRRVVFASSVNAVLGYPRDVVVKTSMPVSPPNLYGATKAWGEAAAGSFVNQGSFSAICLRYGWVQARDSQSIKLDAHELDILITYEDLARLTVASIEAPDDLRFAVFHGVSNNRSSRMDISDAREVLGYQPQDDSFAIAERNAQ